MIQQFLEDYFIAYFIASPMAYYICCFILGVVIGSFLNVMISRFPKMLFRDWRNECRVMLSMPLPDPTELDSKYNLFLPKSHCTQCNYPIATIENIPLISYIFLKGKCRHCGFKISWRYPIIEILSGALTVFLALLFGVTWQALAAMILTWLLIVLSFIDYDHKILPDNLTLPGLWLGLICGYFGIFISLEYALLGAVFGYLSLWAVYWIFKLFAGKEGMGYGDFKLMALLGAWLGWQQLPFIVLCSSVLGVVGGFFGIIVNKNSRNSPFPFGPYLAIAGFIALCYGDKIIEWYLRIM